MAFVDESQADATLAAGADIIGTDEVINQIRNEGWLEFDVTIATPPMMRKVGQIARILGPRGLMPNPKAGTVVPPDDLPRVINELKAGRVEFRNDKTGNVHVPMGKASFTYENLFENPQYRGRYDTGFQARIAERCLRPAYGLDILDGAGRARRRHDLDGNSIRITIGSTVRWLCFF